jgi:NAD(P)-dependent dehydrogenase (short-subunit alcohol dehydrogenase family)
MDLADLASVARAAGELLVREAAIDMVIANAGIMACPETRIGPGWEAQFATNHLGHFAFINRLWPLLTARGSRVVSVSSGAHGITGIRWDDMHSASEYEPWQAYGQSKTANVLFAVELNRRGAAHGVRAFSLHPGAILTPLQRHLSLEEMVSAGWVDEHGNGIDPSFKTVEQGAATAVWAATSARLADRGGEYLIDCDIAPASDVKEWALDPSEAARLWQYSAEVTDLP